MPSIKDDSTVEAIARVFTSNGRIRCRALQEVGYSVKYSEHAGLKLLDNVRVKAAIAKIDAKMRRKSIKNREQRQQFWTDMMDDSDANRSDRLRASELLGKSEADFTENVINRSEEAVPALSSDDRQELQSMGKALDGPKLSQEIA